MGKEEREAHLNHLPLLDLQLEIILLRIRRLNPLQRQKRVILLRLAEGGRTGAKRVGDLRAWEEEDGEGTGVGGVEEEEVGLLALRA